MIIQPTSLAALTWLGAASGTTAESWRIGVVLSARPLGPADQGRILLQVGSMAVEAEAPGQHLPPQFQVRVLSLGTQPTLEVLLPPAAEPVVQRAMRERLPQQNGLPPLLSTVTALGQRAMVRQLPPELRPALAQLERAMRSPVDLTSGEGLREAISRSGLFLESHLAEPTAGQRPTTSTPATEDDWKAALLKLAAALAQRAPERASTAGSRLPGGLPPEDPEAALARAMREQRGALPAPLSRETAPPLLQRGLPPQPRATSATLAALLANTGDDNAARLLHPLLAQLHVDVRAALARLEVAQLEAGTVPAWIAEIPVRGRDGNDVLQLQFNTGIGELDGTRHWTLGFALDLPALGPVQGELQLRDLRLSVRLWAERNDTTIKLEQQFTALRHGLAACGLLLDQLSCQTGLPQASAQHSSMLLKATA